MSSDLDARLERFLDNEETHRQEVVTRLTNIETTLTGPIGLVPIVIKHGEKIRSMETNQTYVKGAMACLGFLWGGLLAYIKVRH